MSVYDARSVTQYSSDLDAERDGGFVHLPSPKPDEIFSRYGHRTDIQYKMDIREDIRHGATHVAIIK